MTPHSTSPEETEISLSRRTLKSIALTRQFQVKYYGWWFLLTAALISLLVFAFLMNFDASWQDVVHSDPKRMNEYLQLRGVYLTRAVSVGVLVMIGVGILGVLTAHRISGPLIALRKAFHEVETGNLGFRLQFRREDDLGELESKFNAMMEALETRYCPRKTQDSPKSR